MPMTTVGDVIIQKIIDWFKGPKKGEGTMKDFLGSIDPQELESLSFPLPEPREDFSTSSTATPSPTAMELGLPTDTGGASAIGKGMYNEQSPLQEIVDSARGGGITTDSYEQDAFGNWPNSQEAMPTQRPSRDIGLQGYSGQNNDWVDRLNAKLFEMEQRKQMSKPPGNQGWR